MREMREIPEKYERDIREMRKRDERETQCEI